jgi:hypothetical protein
MRIRIKEPHECVSTKIFAKIFAFHEMLLKVSEFSLIFVFPENEKGVFVSTLRQCTREQVNVSGLAELKSAIFLFSPLIANPLTSR